jgi:GNAT superfamily N-acetyltransferase
LLRPFATADVPAITARAADFYGARDGGMYTIWSMWPTPDLRDHGLFLSGHPPLMLREPGGNAPAPPAELHVERVTDARTADAYEIALIDGFPIRDLQPARPGAFFEGDVVNAAGWHHYVGFVDDVPVATASAYVGPHTLRVDNVATLPDRRGRGYGAALTWAATLTRPDLPALLLASDDGRPIYERMGYRSISRSTLWLGPRSR